MTNPNIVIFIADHFRADALHHLGNGASYTPNLDRLVREDAVSFQNNFCQNPVCTPSRCSIMSGQYVHVNGHRTMHYMLGKNEPVLMRKLKESGYHILWSGKNDFADLGQMKPEELCHEYVPWRPFIPGAEPVPPAGPKPGLAPEGTPEDNVHYYSFYQGISKPEQLDENGDCRFGSPACGDLPLVEAACGYIEEKRYGEQPFFIYLSPFSPHPPYQAEPKWIEKINREVLPERIRVEEHLPLEPAMLGALRERMALELLTEADWEDIRVCFLAMCARVDSWVGRVIDALKKTGQYDNTIFVFMSDHGDFTGDYNLTEKTQNTFEDCLVHTPLIIKPAAGTPVLPGIRRTLTENIDLTATIEDLAGLKPSHNNSSRSLRQSLIDPDHVHRQAVFCEGGRLRREYQASEYQSLPDTREHRYWPRISIQQQEGEGFAHGKAVMVRTDRYKYVCRLYESDELYDLQNDPKELDNRISDPVMTDVIARMRERLGLFFLETGDAVPISAQEAQVMDARR